MKPISASAIAVAALVLQQTSTNAQQIEGNYTYAQREAAFVEYAKGALLECKQKRLANEVRGFVGSVKCSNSRLSQAWTWYRLGFDDIAALYLATRLEIAERMDRGVLTEGQGQIEMIQAYQQAVAAAQQRQQAANAVAQAQATAAAQAQAAAAREQAARSAAATDALLGAAAIFGAMGQPTRLLYGAYQLPNNVVTCNHMGTTTTCY